MGEVGGAGRIVLLPRRRQSERRVTMVVTRKGRTLIGAAQTARSINWERLFLGASLREICRATLAAVRCQASGACDGSGTIFELGGPFDCAGCSACNSPGVVEPLEPAQRPSMDWGRALRLARSARGLDQGAVAERAGVSRNYVTQIECGRKAPSLEVLERLAAALEVPVWVIAAVGGDAQAVPPNVRVAASAIILSGA